MSEGNGNGTADRSAGGAQEEKCSVEGSAPSPKFIDVTPEEREKCVVVGGRAVLPENVFGSPENIAARTALAAKAQGTEAGSLPVAEEARVDVVVFGEARSAVAADAADAAQSPTGFRLPPLPPAPGDGQSCHLSPEDLDRMAAEIEARSPFPAKESPRRAAWRSIVTATSEYWVASQPDYSPTRQVVRIPKFYIPEVAPKVVPIIAPYVKLDARTTIWPGTMEPGKCSISYRLESLPDEATLEVIRAIDPKLEQQVQALFGKDLPRELGRWLYDDLEDARQADVAILARGTGLDEMLHAMWSIKALVGRWNKIVFPDLNSLVALMDEDVGQAFARYLNWCDGRQPTTPTTLRLSREAVRPVGQENKAEPGQQTPPARMYGILVIDSDDIYAMERDGDRTCAALLPGLPFVDYAALPPSNEVFEKDARGEDKLVKYIIQNPTERDGVLEAVGNYNFLCQRIGNRDHVAPCSVTQSDGKGGVMADPNKKRVVGRIFVNAIFHQAKFVLDSLVDQYRPKPDH